MRSGANILWLGIKELRSLLRDPIMLALIVYACTLGVYSSASSQPETLHKAPIAIVDEDHSPLSARIIDAFYPPYFLPPERISIDQMDAGLDSGRYTFALDIPPHFQRDVLAERTPAIQLNIDATQMNQAFTGGGYVQQIVQGEVAAFLAGVGSKVEQPVEVAVRNRFNSTLTRSWFASVMQIINNMTMLALVLSGAALIREREHGTIEHLLVMPVTPFEIMSSKIWAMGLVVLAGCVFALTVVVQTMLGVPIAGSVPLFLAGAALYLFAATSLGIFLAVMARSMSQFGLLLVLVLLPLQILSGGTSPRENMPEFVQAIMLVAPTTHFVTMAQAILFRGAGLAVVWPQVLALVGIGSIFFAVALARFRKSITTMT